MKAEELRIGNYVNRIVTPSMQNGRIKPSIDLWRIECTDFCSLENFKPIPLTEQWLIDFGFEKDDTGVDIYDQDYHEWYQKEFPVIGVLCQNSDKTYLFDENTNTLRIKYVHQLQNLYFALTGQDLHL